MGRQSIIAFDLDGTLIRNTDSVQVLCDMKNVCRGKIQDICDREEANDISWIDADREKARLMKYLSLDIIAKNIFSRVDIICNFDALIMQLKNDGHKVALITAGPKPVAAIIGQKYGMDYYRGQRLWHYRRKVIWENP